MSKLSGGVGLAAKAYPHFILAALAVALMLVTAAACSSQPPPSEHEDEAGVDTTTADRGNVCSSAASSDLVERFLQADRDDAEAVVELFIAPEPAFEWFSTRDRIQPEAMNRSSLSSYLAEREARNVQQRLEELTFNGVYSGHGNFAFVIRESAPTGTVHYPGKGCRLHERQVDRLVRRLTVCRGTRSTLIDVLVGGHTSPRRWLLSWIPLLRWRDWRASC